MQMKQMFKKGKRGDMVLQLSGKIVIENLRNYPAETVQKLRDRLTAGGEARPEPRRQGFYDLEIDSQVFYIHLTPKGKVLLLAVWARDKRPTTAEEKELVAQPSF